MCVCQDMKSEWLRNQDEETKQEMHSTPSEVWVIMSDGRKRCRGKTQDEGILGTLASLALELGTKWSKFRDWPEQCCQDARAWSIRTRSLSVRQRTMVWSSWVEACESNEHIWRTEVHLIKRVFWMELFATLGADNDMKAKEWCKATHEELSFYGEKIEIQISQITNQQMNDLKVQNSLKKKNRNIMKWR